MSSSVRDQSAAVGAMATEWPLTEALMGGTSAMRRAGEKFMPRFPVEEPEAHKARISKATLFPAFERTVSVMAGKPFSKQGAFSPETPVEIQGKPVDPKRPTVAAVAGWASDIDREGVNLHTFAAEMLAEALAHGLCGILVEAPEPIQTGPRLVTKAEQDRAGIRPYFVRVLHNQILGWRMQWVDGKAVLTQLRLLECTSEPDGEFGEKTVERVRVLEPGKWRLFGKKAPTGVGAPTDEWVQEKAGVTDLKVIPFVPVYGKRKGYMTGVSPLINLAYLNVKHWQRQSDIDTIEHVACVPVLFAKGFEDKDPIVIGASSAIKTSSEKAELKWVEHTGEGVGASHKSIAALEEQMIQSGAELLVKKPGDRSATESANDAEANKSDLQRIVEGFEDSLDQALQMMADFAKLKTGGNYSLFKDFGVALMTEASAQLVLSMQQGGLISKATAIDEMKRRGELKPEVDAEEEAELVEAEGPALGEMTGGLDNTTPPGA